MLRHVLRLAWNRKTSNLLILLEIILSFLVIFSVTAYGVNHWLNSREPMGYDITNVWRLYMENSSRDLPTEERLEKERQLLRAVRSFDVVEAASVMHYPPHAGWTSRDGWELGDRELRTEVVAASPEHPDVFGLDLVTGRFFEDADRHLPYQPVVINRHLALEAFDTVDCIGEAIWQPSEEAGDIERDEGDDREKRVVGVIEDFRKRGEYSELQSILFEPYFVGQHEEELFFIALKLKPDAGPAFEEEAHRQLTALAPGWAFTFSSLEDQRDRYRRRHLTQLLTGGLIAGFLILMVALGLLGVLWQSVTRRTVELGLRRAKGATAGRIRDQILGELLVVTLIGMLLATIVIAQLPLTGLLDFLTGPVIAWAYALSALIMLLFVTLSGLYPSWLASRVQPAVALHHE
ncbi:MAG: FtsX-like permease family protein [Acidobacteriota bacterium]